MPGIESDLLAALRSDPSVSALVGDRIYAGEPPDHLSPSPWIYFVVDAERPTEALGSNDAVVWEVDFELFAKRYQDVRALKRAVRACLNRYRGGNVRRCLWSDSDASAVEGGHNVTERYTVWGTDPTVIPQPGGNARIVTSAGAVHFYPTGGPSPVVTIDAGGRIIGDGSQLTNLPTPDLSAYARLDTPQTFAANQTITGTLSVSGTGTASQRFGASATAVGSNTTAVGSSATARENGSTAVGTSATAGVTGSAVQATAIGSFSSATGAFATVIGSGSSCASDSGVVIGSGLTVPNGRQRAILLGGGMSISDRDQIGLGNGGGEMAFEQPGECLLGSRSAVTSTPFRVTVFGTSTLMGRRMYVLDGQWADPTDAVRRSRFVLSVYSTTTRQAALTVEGHPSGVRMGLFGATPIARPEVRGSHSDGTALADLLTQLAALGAITDLTTP